MIENNNKKIIGGIVFLILVVGGVFGYLGFKPGGWYEEYKFTGCKKSGGEVVDGNCACPKLFPVYNEEKQRCENEFGQFVESRQELEILQQRYKFSRDCVGEKKGEVYVVPTTPLTFCFNPERGYPKREVKTNFTSVYFVPEGGGEPMYNEPKIYYFTDNQVVEDLNLGCPDCLTVDLNQEEIKIENSELTVNKVEIGDKQALRVFAGGNLEYYVPNAFDENNLVFRIASDKANILDAFVQTLWFDENAD